MRELKFRAWWKDTKRILDGDEWYMTCSGAKHLHYAVIPYSDDDFIVEQYTDLKDKNGEEIYENDILEDGSGEPLEYWVVRFEDGKFIGSTQGVNEDIFELTDLEIIGNIHENPELLEEKWQ